MLGSLRARLIISFALVVALAVFLAGAGALFLLRDQQQETARERYGRFAEPFNVRVSAMLERGAPVTEVTAYLASAADQADVRVMLLDQDLQVVFDSEKKLDGKFVLSFENQNAKLVDSRGTHYKWTNYDNGGTHLTL